MISCLKDATYGCGSIFSTEPIFMRAISYWFFVFANDVQEHSLYTRISCWFLTSFIAFSLYSVAYNRNECLRKNVLIFVRQIGTTSMFTMTEYLEKRSRDLHLYSLSRIFQWKRNNLWRVSRSDWIQMLLTTTYEAVNELNFCLLCMGSGIFKDSTLNALPLI